ncbi:MAG: hypothetical protein NVS9B15_17700 [Acidobacteriaceae bacterium]
MSAWTIAVIIPTFNAMKFLRETLDSVFGQTCLPDEIVINDDASGDGTPEFAESYGRSMLALNPSAPKIRVLRRGGQRQAKSRNYAATQTDCEWIAFLDHDDIWEPTKLERQVAELKRTGADLCYASLSTFEQVGSEVVVRPTPPVPSASCIREALYHSTTFLPSSVLVRRAKFVESGGFNTELTIAEDWELWLRLYHSGVKFAACEEMLVRYRIHSNNQSRNALKSLEEAMAVYRQHVLPHHPSLTRWLTYRRTRSAHEYAAALALRNNGDPRQIGMLASSLATFPLSEPHRYKVLAHMMYMRLRNLLRPVPALAPGSANAISDTNVVVFPVTRDAASKESAA